ncbi:L-ribulose-5-phosphate 4-epimerase AraD [Pontibacillus yanchengensis]|uniref:L-ribulose-5-phosphate 4-epimerase n=1 Tax=Pontibacillus yanchengensis TaxID=462910 RepID=A0A6I5A6A6_9BACI|nr:L-ribulose-5-phosphate 4-epimerase [Pontibacillus yanchengensis]MYL35833.1 L-ribulose-5-phosphate 4-epimerase AraD [Pontibacillus yanchengensis]
MLEELKEKVLQANLELPQRDLVILTWGNVSGIDRNSGYVVIKPSGVVYEELTLESLPVVDLEGNVVEGTLRPSSDTETHLQLYKAFPDIGGIVHTHSSWGVRWAQAGRSIPTYGTTHADYFNDKIPCTRDMTEREINNNYEYNTGKVIVESFENLNPLNIPGILVKEHGPFNWGEDPMDAVDNAMVMEEIASSAYYTEQLSGEKGSINPYLLEKHFSRKHGENAYYGQY